MNIFVLDDDPRLAAQAQCNKHVVKMILETAQLLSTALRLRGDDVSSLLYKSTHVNHPCTKWVVHSAANMSLLWHHGDELLSEYNRRYAKVHACANLFTTLSYLGNVDHTTHSPFAMAMPDEWKTDDPVESYRLYYIACKSTFAKWRPRSHPPSWWPFKEIEL